MRHRWEDVHLASGVLKGWKCVRRGCQMRRDLKLDGGPRGGTIEFIVVKNGAPGMLRSHFDRMPACQGKR